MEPGITWYDVLDVLPGAEPAKIRREYDAKTSLLRPELIAGAPSNVLQAISLAQGMLDEAWRVLGDPVSRERYDESIGVRGSGGHLREPGSNPDGSGLEPPDPGTAEGPGADAAGGAMTRTGWSLRLAAPSPRTSPSRSTPPAHARSTSTRRTA